MTTVAARFPTNAGSGDISRFADVLTETTEMLASCAGTDGGCPYTHPPSPPSSYSMGPPSGYPTGAPISSYPAAPPAQQTDYPTVAPPPPPATTQPVYDTWTNTWTNTWASTWSSATWTSNSSSGGYWTQPPGSAYPTATPPPSWGNGHHGGNGGGNGGAKQPTPTEPASPPVFTDAASSLDMSEAALIAIIGAFIL
jgi:hypothetical protein